VPIFDYLCNDCGKQSEMFVPDLKVEPLCMLCGSKNLRKTMRKISSFSKESIKSFPISCDTSCCDSRPSRVDYAESGIGGGKDYGYYYKVHHLRLLNLLHIPKCG
jgi:putative FmdB family regulatory protein